MTEAILPSDLLPLPLPYVPRAAIFDCDGTLIDTMPLHYQAWRETVEPLGAVLPEDLFYAWSGVTAHEITIRLNRDQGLAMAVEETVFNKEERYRALIPLAQPIPLVVAEVYRFHTAGVPLAIASGGMNYVVKESLEATGLLRFFKALATADDVVHGKPAPDVFLLAAERLGVEPATCVVYEDGDAGLEAAHRAGMRAVDVRPFLPPRISAAL